MFVPPSEMPRFQYAFYDAWHTSRRFTGDEPALVHRFAGELALRADRLRDGPYELSVTTSFVHQTSKVHFASSLNPRATREAGDLLIVTGLHETGHRSEHHALLLQAKIAKSRRDFVRVPTDESSVEQHELYANWPRIDYDWGIARQRTIGRRAGGSGVAYLLIPRPTGRRLVIEGESRLSSQWMWDEGATAQAVGIRQLEWRRLFIPRMLRMLDGHGMPYAPGGRSDWDGFVDDMQSLSATKLFPAHSGAPRIHGSLALSLASVSSWSDRFTAVNTAAGDVTNNPQLDFGGLTIINLDVRRSEQVDVPV